MNPVLKQRLVGGVVLVALAVIFLPMLLPGKSDSTMPLFGSNVPTRPDTNFVPIEIPLALPPPAPASEVSVVDQPQPGDVVSNEKPQLMAPVPSTAAVAAPPSSKPPHPATPQSAPVKPAATAPSTKPAPATATAPAHASSEAWAVQLGSFSSSANAITLQEKARKAGFRAYVEKVKSGGSTGYRVRIGPESSRERADATKARVEAKLKMKAMVVPHKS